MRPWTYVRLRREAARMTIAEAARPHWHRPEHRDQVEKTFAEWEQPGQIIDRWAVATVGRSFAFNAEVYRQLVSLPENLHPPICMACGCTDQDAPIARDGNPGTVGANGLCTACAERRGDNPSLLL